MNNVLRVLTIKSATDDGNQFLENQVIQSGLKIEFIQGVKGDLINAKKYYSRIIKYNKLKSKIISPSEYACTEGHVSIMEKSIEEGGASQLIFEDDVIFKDGAIDKLKNIKTPTDGEFWIIHLGGLNGVKRNYSKARVDFVRNGLHKINQNDYELITRLAGYIISKSLMDSIVKYHQASSFVVDDFDFINKYIHSFDLYCIDIIDHPEDLKSSAIEAERMIRKSNDVVSEAGLVNKIKKKWFRLMRKISTENLGKYVG